MLNSEKESPLVHAEVGGFSHVCEVLLPKGEALYGLYSPDNGDKLVFFSLI